MGDPLVVWLNAGVIFVAAGALAYLGCLSSSTWRD